MNKHATRAIREHACFQAICTWVTKWEKMRSALLGSTSAHATGETLAAAAALARCMRTAAAYLRTNGGEEKSISRRVRAATRGGGAFLGAYKCRGRAWGRIKGVPDSFTG